MLFRACLCLTAAIATLGLAGRAIHSPVLQGWGSNLIAMKDTTAWLVLEHCWAGFIVSRPEKIERNRHALPVFFIVATSLLMAVGIVWEIANTPGELAGYDPLKSFYPSVMTVAGMSLLAFKATAALLPTWWAQWAARAFSGGAAVIGACALCGYALGLPAFYYYNPGYTTAMAVNTAVCLLLLGLVDVPRREN